jgi:hypothetical protein
LVAAAHRSSRSSETPFKINQKVEIEKAEMTIGGKTRIPVATLIC